MSHVQQGCSLRDLAPGEKAKVAQLMQKIVALQNAASERERLLQEALAQQQRLREQNAGVARDNGSLRAKLTHAFALLKTYQHKVRVLHAALQSSSGAVAASTQLGAELGDDWPDEGPCSGSTADSGSAVGEGQAGGALSPIQEEAPVPGSYASNNGRAGGRSYAADQAAVLAPAQAVPPMQLQQGSQQQATLQLQQPRQALQQHLEPLTLLARALLEAQAEMLSSRAQQAGAAAPAAVQPAPHAGLQCDAPAATASSICCSKENVATNCQATGSGAGAQQEAGACQQQFIVSSMACAPPALSASPSSVHSAAGQPRHRPGPAAAYPPAFAQLQHHPHQHHRHQQQPPLQATERWYPADFSSRGPAALCGLDPSLLDIVEDVEGMLGGGWQAAAAGARSSAAWWPHSCTSRPASQCGGNGCGELFEENDLLSIIAALE